MNRFLYCAIEVLILGAVGFLLIKFWYIYLASLVVYFIVVIVKHIYEEKKNIGVIIEYAPTEREKERAKELIQRNKEQYQQVKALYESEDKGNQSVIWEDDQ